MGGSGGRGGSSSRWGIQAQSPPAFLPEHLGASEDTASRGRGVGAGGAVGTVSVDAAAEEPPQATSIHRRWSSRVGWFLFGACEGLVLRLLSLCTRRRLSPIPTWGGNPVHSAGGLGRRVRLRAGAQRTCRPPSWATSAHWLAGGRWLPCVVCDRQMPSQTRALWAARL